ncbi:FCD domain-containing protein [Chelativorans sp.]|uniref:FCD domain-containing protein n=1 Tax=Chelativorans sp. TaxID=2203393 RepID=UPI0035C70287
MAIRDELDPAGHGGCESLSGRSRHSQAVSGTFFQNAIAKISGGASASPLQLRRLCLTCQARTRTMRAGSCSRLAGAIRPREHRQRTFQEHLEMVEAVDKRDAAALRGSLTAHIGEMEPNYRNALQLI